MKVLKIITLLFFQSIFFIHASEEWISLFDGKSTKGWQPRSEVVSFEAKDGELHLLSKTNCWVTTDIEMADFEVEIEVLMPEYQGFNSGLAFRCVGKRDAQRAINAKLIEKNQPEFLVSVMEAGYTQEKDKVKHSKIKSEEISIKMIGIIIELEQLVQEFKLG